MSIRGSVWAHRSTSACRSVSSYPRGYCRLRPPPKSISPKMCCPSCGRTASVAMDPRNRTAECGSTAKAWSSAAAAWCPAAVRTAFCYHRISGNAFGMQMPPTGALRPEQIKIIKTWIDQGADWPDSLANEAELPPLESQSCRHGRVAARRRPGRVHEVRRGRSQASQCARTGGFHAIHVRRALYRRGHARAALETRRRSQQTQ